LNPDLLRADIRRELKKECYKKIIKDSGFTFQKGKKRKSRIWNKYFGEGQQT
jgi:hypothetical protein